MNECSSLFETVGKGPDACYDVVFVAKQRFEFNL